MAGPSVTETMEPGQILRECAESCSETFAYCLSQGGDHVDENHLKALVDCAELCNVAANFVARESEVQHSLLEACADACNRCAETCEEFDDDDRMQDCAELCRRCEDACQ